MVEIVGLVEEVDIALIVEIPIELPSVTKIDVEGSANYLVDDILSTYINEY